MIVKNCCMTQRIWVDDFTGRIASMIPARDLYIVWGDDSSYWEWVRRDDSRFEHVARLRYVWWFDVWQRLNCNILSPNTHYTVSFIVRMDKNSVGYGNLSSRYGYGHLSSFIFSVVRPDGVRMESARFLDDLEKSVETHGQGFSLTPLSQDENGWIEFVAGEFFLEEQRPCEGAKEIEFSMKNIDCTFTKSDIWVDCVKIEPKH
ncbi:hypothetical protein SUGI_0284040 [Cryptomeria japonica]|nr:hypothetical protein SUGI_0284040 [Cryptomeria japonica]